MNYFLSDIENEKYLRDGFILRSDQFSKTELVNYRNSLEKTVLKAQTLAGSGKKYFLDKKKFIDIDFLTLQYEPQPNEKEIYSQVRVCDHYCVYISLIKLHVTCVISPPAPSFAITWFSKGTTFF